jgi:two-component system, response regulator PdtaR
MGQVGDHPSEEPKYDGVILIIEDNVILRSSVAEHLRGCGFRVVEGHDADEALDLLEATVVDLVFTDVSMSGSMDGLQLANFVHRRWPHTAVIVTSGVANPESIPAFHAKARWIAKPYDYDVLERLIRNMLD